MLIDFMGLWRGPAHGPLEDGLDTLGAYGIPGDVVSSCPLSLRTSYSGYTHGPGCMWLLIPVVPDCITYIASPFTSCQGRWE